MSRPYSSNEPSSASFYPPTSDDSFKSHDRRKSHDVPPPRISGTDEYADSRYNRNRRNSQHSSYDVHNGPRYRKDTPRSPARAENPAENQAKNDLEILERLKERIKNGQHEVYRAIPQPAILASLYLGSSSTAMESTDGRKLLNEATRPELTQSSVKTEPTSPKFPPRHRVCNALNQINIPILIYFSLNG
jgi:hypothetical protein